MVYPHFELSKIITQCTIYFTAYAIYAFAYWIKWLQIFQENVSCIDVVFMLHDSISFFYCRKYFEARKVLMVLQKRLSFMYVYIFSVDL